MADNILIMENEQDKMSDILNKIEQLAKKVQDQGKIIENQAKQISELKVSSV